MFNIRSAFKKAFAYINKKHPSPIVKPTVSATPALSTVKPSPVKINREELTIKLVSIVKNQLDAKIRNFLSTLADLCYDDLDDSSIMQEKKSALASFDDRINQFTNNELFALAAAMEHAELINEYQEVISEPLTTDDAKTIKAIIDKFYDENYFFDMEYQDEGDLIRAFENSLYDKLGYSCNWVVDYVDFKTLVDDLIRDNDGKFTFWGYYQPSCDFPDWL